MVVRAANDPSVDNALVRLQALHQYHPAGDAAFLASAERIWSELKEKQQFALLDVAYAYAKPAYEISQDPVWIARTAWIAAHREQKQ